MEMQEIKQENGIIFLKLAGRLDLAGVGQVEAAFKTQTNEAEKGLVVDAAELSFLASLGMRMLMMGAKTLKAKGGKIVIVSPQEEVENALRMSGLDQVIPLVESEAEAISELGWNMQISLEESFNADYDSFTAFAEKVAAYHKRAGLTGQMAYAADLALEELVTNIVKYGNIDGNLIHVSMHFDGGSLQIRIVDSGSKFDPTLAPEPDLSLPLEERPVGQMGLAMVRNMFDRFEYTRDGNKNIVELSVAGKKE